MQKFKVILLNYLDFENRDVILSKAFHAFSACQDSDLKKNLGFSFEKSSSCGRLSTETLMKEFELNHVLQL